VSRRAGGVAFVVWLVALALLSSWSNTSAALAGAAIATVALGVVAGHFAVVLVPLALGTAVAVATLVAGDDPTDSDGTPASTWALFVWLWTVGLAALAALGVGLRKVVRAARRR
jgi:hypothetical protein